MAFDTKVMSASNNFVSKVKPSALSSRTMLAR